MSVDEALLRYYLLLIRVSVIIFVQVEADANISYTTKLRTDLLRYYDRSTNGPDSEDRATKVNISLKIRAFDLDYGTSLASINGWLSTEWIDERLMWNPTDFGGLKDVKLAHYEIWTPDIVALNSPDQSMYGSYTFTHYTVSWPGKVEWSPPIMFKAFCELDVTEWPFDKQTCTLELGSLSYESSKLSLYYEKSPDEYFSTESKYGWKILNVDVNKTEQYNPCCPEPYSKIIYKIQVQKAHHVYHSFIYLPPLVVCLLLLSAFFLPSHMPEKFLLTSTLSVLCCLFLAFLSAKIPFASQQTPNIISFYCFVLCLSIFYLIFTACLFSLGQSQEKKFKKPIFPNAIENIFNAPTVQLILNSSKKLTEKKENARSSIYINENDSVENRETYCSEEDDARNVIYLYQIVNCLERLLLIIYSVTLLYQYFHRVL